MDKNMHLQAILHFYWSSGYGLVGEVSAAQRGRSEQNILNKVIT